ncbi:MAG: hypothetical protein U1E50_10260 [Caulobacteraceae bacterium]
MLKLRITLLAGSLCLAAATPALAGPPYLTDDPTPTDKGHWEVLPFVTGGFSGDPEGDVGLDLSYGATDNIQLTATLPLGYERPSGSGLRLGAGNIELAAKIRLLRQEESGLELAVFPRLYLPGSGSFADDHAAFLLPVFIGRSGETWSAFGGGGWGWNEGGGSKNYCQLGAVITRQVLPNLNLGLEGSYRTADVVDGEASGIICLGAVYDVNETFHVLGYAGAEVANRAANGDGVWYVSVLWVF